MPTPTLERLAWQVERHDQRLRVIEETKPELMAYELRELKDEMQSFRRAIVSVGVAVVGSTIVFALTMFVAFGQ
jgi:long-subunit acyl-CoA synthetase (AMP-forming)